MSGPSNELRTGGFLSTAELAQLTGYEPGQRARMAAWLKRHGYVFATNSRGDLVVLWEHVRAKLSADNARPPVPNLEAAFAPLRAYHAKRQLERPARAK